MIESLEVRQLLAAGSFGINVEISPYTSFVNLLQTPGDWINAPNQSNAIVLNASGDPESDAALLFDMRVNQSFNGPDPNAVAPNLSGTYNLSFNGQAVISSEYPGFSTPFTVQNQVYNAATNTTTVQLVVPTVNTSDFFSIAFTNTQATATSATGTGFSNARLIRPGYAATSIQLYTNEFLAALQPYSTLRYLDPEDTNSQPFFNGLTLVTVGASQVDQTGLPWEYQIALANQTQTDMWINIPEGATNAYITALAGIFKNGGTVGGVSYPGLDSNLKVYVEYSDEVWGGIPYNEYYQEAAVENGATNQPLSTFAGNLDVYTNADGSTSTDVNVAVGRRYLEETYDIGQIFQSVMGSDPTHQRIRPVLGWQEDVPSFFPTALNWFQHFFGPASSAFYGMGDANYLNSTDDSSVSSIISTMQAQLTSYAIPDTTDYTTLATYYGLANVSYEGGPSIGGDGTTAAGQNALAASRSPAMEQVVLQEYEDFYAAGGTLGMFYDGPFAGWTPQNEWGAAELAQYGNPIASAKYRGTLDVANALPVAVTAGVAIPPGSSTSFAASTDTLGDNFSSPATGQQGFWLLNVASAGTYDLKLTTATGSQTPGQVEVLVNNKQVGGIISVSASSLIDLGNLVLPAGLNTLSLVVVHGANDPSQTNYQFSPMTFTLASPGAVVIGDNGFENVSVGSGAYQYNPTGSVWTFAGTPGNGSGITGNNSGFTSGNPNAPQGSQVAFLQGVTAITQSVAGWSAGSYALSFDAARRGNSGGIQNFEVLVDGNVVGTFVPSSTTYQSYTTSSFTVSAGTHAIEFLGLDSAGGDNTDFLDAVTVASASPSPAVPPSAPASPNAPTVGDSSFEAVSVGYGNFAYNPSGSAWIFAQAAGGGSGLAGNNSGFTSGNPNAPLGSQVAFLQKVTAIVQSVSGWGSGSYTLSFDAAARNFNGIQQEDFEVLVDGVVVGTFKPALTLYQSYTTNAFSVSAGTHLIEFLGLDTVGGDNTALIDAVSVAVASTPSTPSAVPSLGDSGFESVAVGTGNYAYDPSGSAWTFAGFAGVSGNGSGFTSGSPNAPQGAQVAFLQEKGSITQSLSGWSTGSYILSFNAAQRSFNGVQQEDFEVLVDGVVVGTFKPSGVTYQSYITSSFAVSAGTHVIQFLGLDTVGGDNTALLDAVSLTVFSAPSTPSAPSAVPSVGDSGFESVAVGTGNYAYDPSGSAWSFAGYAGVTGNSSGFTGGNPNAPQGAQVAFLQETGSITQSIAGWAAGSYAISFDAAQRNWNGIQKEDFEVLVDGVVVGSFTPTSLSYQSYTTGLFTVTAGTHVVEFLGLDNGGGDNTAFVDAVTVAVATVPAALPTVGDSGFEAATIGNGNYAYSPTGSAWTFNSSANLGGTGVSGNNSTMTSGNPAAPQGSQVAFIEAIAGFTQTVSGWAAGSYALSFDAAQRGNYGTQDEDFEVLIDGVVVGTFQPNGNLYQSYTTSTFTVSAGSHAIEFLGVDTARQDYTALIDAVTIV